MRHSTKYGFTLTELLSVVTIITILITASVIGGVRVWERARAQRIATEFREIETAWLAWRSDTHMAFPSEASPGYVLNGPCLSGGGSNFAAQMSTTHLYDSDPDGDGIDPTESDSTLWNGPYLDRIIYDPYGVEYDYDNEANGDAYIASNCTNPALRADNVSQGTNITLDWCTQAGSGTIGNYQPLLRHINAIVDGNEGSAENAQFCGKFRWSNPTSYGGRMFYMIEAEEVTP